MGVFYLKHGDTRPVLEAILKNPDGTVHDLTGVTSVKLHVQVGAVPFTRDMNVVGDPTTGTVQYAWAADDWITAPALPALKAGKSKDLNMEYEAVGGSSDMTFPNNGYDTLQIWGEIG